MLFPYLSEDIGQIECLYLHKNSRLMYDRMPLSDPMTMEVLLFIETHRP